jgi:protein associated with RNAse G/E
MGKELATIDVIKYNLQGEEVWRYPGRILLQTAHAILLEATFDRGEVNVEGLLLRQGDRFVELYLRECWYNIYQIYAGRDDYLKGWYCNITFPPSITTKNITYVDLALDLVIFPDGRRVILDREEFEALNLEGKDRKKAKAALEELQKCFTHVDLISLERWASQGGCSIQTV